MEKSANQILKHYFGKEPDYNKRFYSGYCGYVFHVIYGDQNYILKLYDESNRHCVKSTVYWLNKLQDLDLQIPKVIHFNIEDSIPYVILSYIYGTDLGEVYSSLSAFQKKNIAKEIIHSQNELKKLNVNTGYGYLTSFDDSNQKLFWIDVLTEHLNRSKKGIYTNKIFQTFYVDETLLLLPKFSKYFSKIKPIPFFDDATTKNVLINKGRFSGIIDFDSLCFGDDLYTIALTRMSLLNMNADTVYVDYLKDYRNFNPEEEIILDLYTLIFCVDFMSEKGMKFNRYQVEPVSEIEKTRLIEIYRNLYQNLVDCANFV